MNSSTVAWGGGAHAVRCELASEVLASSGTLRLRVTGWSMLPTIWPGDTLVIERANRDAVSKGDIVLFQRDRRFFVHRIVGKSAEDSTILTCGDAMPQQDPPVVAQDLLGKVAFILRDGKCLQPARDLSVSSRAVAAAVRRSDIAARIIVRVHSMFQRSLDRNSNKRDVPCQS